MGYATFDTKEQAQRAIKLLDGQEFLGTSLNVGKVMDTAFGRKYGVRIYGLDPHEPIENVEKLCNDALGIEDAAKHVLMLALDKG